MGGGPADRGAPAASALGLDAAKKPCPGHTQAMAPRALKRKPGRVTGRETTEACSQPPTLMYS